MNDNCEKLNDLHDLTLELKQDCYKYQEAFSEDDIRTAFFGLMYTTLHEYYLGRVTFRLYQLFGTKDILFGEGVVQYKPHFTRLYEVKDHPVATEVYFRELNINIFLGSWTPFETSVGLLFDEISNVEDRINIIYDMNNKLVKISNKLDEEDKKSLMSIIESKRFIPLHRKFKYLRYRKKTQYSNQDYKKDKEFINFCATLRNTILHSNGIYYGNDFSYEFKKSEFVFINKKEFSIKNTFEDLFIEIFIELKAVFSRLLNCTLDKKNMEYPESCKV